MVKKVLPAAQEVRKSYRWVRVPRASTMDILSCVLVSGVKFQLVKGIVWGCNRTVNVCVSVVCLYQMLICVLTDERQSECAWGRPPRHPAPNSSRKGKKKIWSYWLTGQTSGRLSDQRKYFLFYFFYLLGYFFGLEINFGLEIFD